MRTSRRSLLGLIAGLALVIGPIAFWAASTPAPSPVPAEPEVAAPPVRSGDRGEPPTRLRVPDTGIDAAVVPVGVDGRGDMEVPVDVRTVGWYRFGPAPGAAAGASVLAGHVDDRRQGRGAFQRLGDLADGDVVQVELAGGRVLDYRVRSVAVTAKRVLPVEQIFDRTGPPRLVLVTCGGDFDRASRAYRDNVVVTAEPAL